MPSMARQNFVLLFIVIFLTVIITLSVWATTKVPYMMGGLLDHQPLSTLYGDKSNLYCLDPHPHYPQYTFFSPAEDQTWEFVVQEPVTDPGKVRPILARDSFIIRKAEANRCLWKLAKKVYKYGIWRGSIFYQAGDRDMGFINSWTLKGPPNEYWIRRAERALDMELPWVQHVLVFGFSGLALISLFVTVIGWWLDPELRAYILKKLRIRNRGPSSASPESLGKGEDRPAAVELEAISPTDDSGSQFTRQRSQEWKWHKEAQQRKVEFYGRRRLSAEDPSRLSSDMSLWQQRKMRQAEWTSHYQQRLRRATYISGPNEESREKPVNMSEVDIRRIAANDSTWSLPLDRMHMHQAAATGNYQAKYVNRVLTASAPEPVQNEVEEEIDVWNNVLRNFQGRN